MHIMDIYYTHIQYNIYLLKVFSPSECPQRCAVGMRIVALGR
jgi:hypothetical protein